MWWAHQLDRALPCRWTLGLWGPWMFVCECLSASLGLSVVITGAHALELTPQPPIGSVNRWVAGGPTASRPLV